MSRPLHRLTVSSMLLALALPAAFYALFVWLPFDSSQVRFGNEQARLFERAGAILAGELVYLGPRSSRLGLAQPGPASLYLLAISYWGADQDIARTSLVTAGINVLTLVAVSLVTFRLFGSITLAALAPLLVAANVWFLYYLKVVSNLGVATPLVALGLWFALEAWAGSGVALAATVVVLSIAAQANAALVPLAAVVGGLTLIGFASSRAPIPRLPLWISTVLALTLWAPVLYDVAINQGGNLLGTFRLVVGSGAGRSLGDAVSFVRQAAAEGMAGWPASGWPVLVASGGWTVPGAVALYRAHRAVSWWALMLATAWLTFAWSVLRAPGSPATYFLSHAHLLAGLTVTSAVGVTVLLARAWSASVTRVLLGAAALALGLPAVLSLDVHRRQLADPGWNDAPLPAQVAIVEAVRQGLTSAVLLPDRFMATSTLTKAASAARVPVPMDFIGADGSVESFRFLSAAAGLELTAPGARPHYRVFGRGALFGRGVAPNLGREVLTTPAYVLVYVPAVN